MSYIHALRDAHTRIYSCLTYMHARIPVVHTYTNVYARIRAHTFAYIRILVFHTYTNVYTCVYTYTDAHTHIHAQEAYDMTYDMAQARELRHTHTDCMSRVILIQTVCK